MISWQNLHNVSFIIPPETLASLREENPPEIWLHLPIVMVGNRVVDGIKRVLYAQEKGIDQLPSLTFDEDPFALRVYLNCQRKWSLLEIAFMWDKLSRELKVFLAKSQGFGFSPKLSPLFQVIRAHQELWEDMSLNPISLSTLKDLASCGERAPELIHHFLKLKATVGEKRLLARLALLAAEQNRLPESLPLNKHQLKALLEEAAFPHLARYRQQFHQALKDLGFPHWVKISLPASLETPGVEVRMHLQKKGLATWQALEKKWEALFEACSFLG